jgi:hypothetical protein
MYKQKRKLINMLIYAESANSVLCRIIQAVHSLHKSWNELEHENHQVTFWLALKKEYIVPYRPATGQQPQKKNNRATDSYQATAEPQ